MDTPQFSACSTKSATPKHNQADHTFTWKDNIINRGKQQLHIIIIKVNVHGGIGTRAVYTSPAYKTLDDAVADQYRYYEHVRTGARTKFKRRYELFDPPPVDLRVVPPSEANSGQDVHFQCQLPSSVIVL